MDTFLKVSSDDDPPCPLLSFPYELAIIMSDKSKRVAVIGAGISGVVTAGHLLAVGIDVTVFERSHAAGGVW
jgi:NADPH-dependent glutamate synthase beta subunit-like oxidoreductase